MEEIGLRPRRLTKILRFFPTPGVSGEIMHLYLAENLVLGSGEKDEDEEIEHRELSGGQIERKIQNGKIIDAKTILGYYILKKALK